MNEERRQRIRNLNSQADELERKRQRVLEERNALEDLETLEDHPCHCVNQNSKMGIHDMREQETRGRAVVGYRSLVAESFTASKSCPDCGGTGKPRP